VTNGLLELPEFCSLIQHSPLVISVNTGTVHIASAVKTKVIVLYALTNPQHSPWKTIGKVFPFSVPKELQSRNEVLQFVCQKHFPNEHIKPTPEQIVDMAMKILDGEYTGQIPEIILQKNN
jgi:ADP-heptose:LPS heptosyltransferase